MLFVLPLVIVAAPVSLSAWYLCRALPLSRTRAVRVAVTALGAALMTSSLWAGVGRAWWQVPDAVRGRGPADVVGGVDVALLGLGAFGVSAGGDGALSPAGVGGVGWRRGARSRPRSRIATPSSARLRAQVDPHFLFNSLN